MKLYTLPILLGFVVLAGCQETKGDTGRQDSNISNQVTQNTPDPEDNPKIVGTPVLKFKLRHSTVDSVKKRLIKFEEIPNDSYMGGSIINSNGQSFDLHGLETTQFGFDEKGNLVYVYMGIAEEDHMQHTTYNKIVGYIKEKNYKLIKEEKPFVGNRFAIFSTPNNETIIVNSPHLGGFIVQVEYLTNEFKEKRNSAQADAAKNQANQESKNF